MRTKLLFFVFLVISLYSCNNTQNSVKQDDTNVETYYGKEAAIMFANNSNSGSTATYRTSNGYYHWLCINTLTATKYDFSYKGKVEKPDIDIETAVMKITKNINVDKEMATITILQMKTDTDGDKIFPLIDNINDLSK